MVKIKAVEILTAVKVSKIHLRNILHQTLHSLINIIVFQTTL